MASASAPSLPGAAAATAFLTGISMLSLPIHIPTIVLITFYLLSASALVPRAQANHKRLRSRTATTMPAWATTPLRKSSPALPVHSSSPATPTSPPGFPGTHHTEDEAAPVMPHLHLCLRPHPHTQFRLLSIVIHSTLTALVDPRLRSVAQPRAPWTSSHRGALWCTEHTICR